MIATALPLGIRAKETQKSLRFVGHSVPDFEVRLMDPIEQRSGCMTTGAVACKQSIFNLTMCRERKEESKVRGKRAAYVDASLPPKECSDPLSFISHIGARRVLLHVSAPPYGPGLTLYQRCDVNHHESAHYDGGDTQKLPFLAGGRKNDARPWPGHCNSPKDCGVSMKGVWPGLNGVRGYVIVPAYTHIGRPIRKDPKKNNTYHTTFFW